MEDETKLEEMTHKWCFQKNFLNENRNIVILISMKFVPMG